MSEQPITIPFDEPVTEEQEQPVKRKRFVGPDDLRLLKNRVIPYSGPETVGKVKETVREDVLSALNVLEPIFGRPDYVDVSGFLIYRKEDLVLKFHNVSSSFGIVGYAAWTGKRSKRETIPSQVRKIEYLLTNKWNVQNILGCSVHAEYFWRFATLCINYYTNVITIFVGAPIWDGNKAFHVEQEEVTQG